MFDRTSRTVYENGLRFYEEDVLFDSHLYYASQVIHLEFDYVKNGAGMMIGLMANQPLNKQHLYYFVRLDHYSASLFFVNHMHYERIEHVSTPYTAPIKAFKVKITITPAQIILNLNGRNYMYAHLNYSIGAYHLGLYSQKHNTFKKLWIESESPKHWKINMQGAKNGRLTFAEDEAHFSQCKYPVEMIQENISLTKGTYYLNGIKEDVKAYLYRSDDTLANLKQKNLLNQDYSFEIERDEAVTLYFASKEGTLKDIAISKSPNAPYIQTHAHTIERNFSALGVRLDKAKEVTVKFDIQKGNSGWLYRDENMNTIMRYFQVGTYTIHIKDNTLTFSNASEVMEIDQFSGNRIELLADLDCFVHTIEITDKNDDVFDWFKRQDKTDWIKPSLNSPIIALDQTGEPLDLSASFRKIGNKYIFTNTERESFGPYDLFKMQSPIASLVNVYGIPKHAPVDASHFYTGTKEDINDLSAYCYMYEPLPNCIFDLATNQVTIPHHLDKYKEIVIDYKKQNSYTLNYTTELGMYNVQTTADHYSYCYNIDGQSDYRYTYHKQQEGYYVVLEKGDL